MTIKTKFVLEGLDTIIAQLKTFGAAGEDAARQLQTAIEKINTKKLEEDLSKVRESSDQMVRSLLNFQTILAGTTIGIVAKAVYEFARAGIDSAVALERNAAAAGMSAEKFQVLAEAMKNAGGSQEQLNTALRRFTMQVDTQGQEQLKNFADITKDFIQATGGLGGMSFKTVADFDRIREAATRAAPVLRDFIIKALPESLRDINTLFPVEAIAGKLQQLLQVNQKFREEFFKVGFDIPAQSIGESLDKILERSKGTLSSLGISLIDLGGKIKTPEKAFLEFVDAVSKMQTPAEQAAAIIKVFGRSAGPELAKVIREGTASLRELQAFLESKGILFSPEQLEKAQEADRAFNKLSASWRSFRNEFGIGLSPTFIAVLDSLTEAVDRFGKQTKANQDEVREWWDAITEIANSENPFATFWSKAGTAFKSSFDEFVEGTKQEIGLLQRVWQITAANPNISPLRALMQAYGEVKAKSQESAQSVTLDWSASADSIKGSFETAGDAVELNFDQMQKKAEAATSKVEQAISKNKWITPTGTVPAPTAPSAMLTPTAPPTQTTQTLLAPFQEADNQIRTLWLDLTQWIAESLGEVNLSALTAALVAPFTAAVPLIRDELAKVETMIDTIMREAAAAAGMIEQLGRGGRPGGGGGGFAFQEVAGGGYIRGPGTTTSDSIPAWLSNREFVVRAKAVDHYGANLFAALNSMRLPKDLFSHFAIGGLANALARTMPRYAAGGLATASAGGRSLTIVLDGQKFGLSGSSDVIGRLERVATMAGIASVGRPPGWVR